MLLYIDPGTGSMLFTILLLMPLLILILLIKLTMKSIKKSAANIKYM